MYHEPENGSINFWPSSGPPFWRRLLVERHACLVRDHRRLAFWPAPALVLVEQPARLQRRDAALGVQIERPTEMRTRVSARVALVHRNRRGERRALMQQD